MSDYQPPEINDSRGPGDITPSGAIVIPIVVAVVYTTAVVFMLAGVATTALVWTIAAASTNVDK